MMIKVLAFDVSETDMDEYSSPDSRPAHLSNQSLTLRSLSSDESISERMIISIGGMPFYRSTGNNSGAANTWLPFFGINVTDQRGWFIKPGFHPHIPEAVTSKIFDCFKSYPEYYKLFGYYNDKDRVYDRFASLPCLLVSSRLGGGLWDSEEGKNFIEYLKKEYPDFYNKIGSIEVCEPEKIVDETESDSGVDEEVNQWLLTRSGCSKLEDLRTVLPLSLAELYSRLLEPTLPNVSDLQQETVAQTQRYINPVTGFFGVDNFRKIDVKSNDETTAIATLLNYINGNQWNDKYHRVLYFFAKVPAHITKMRMLPIKNRDFEHLKQLAVKANQSHPLLGRHQDVATLYRVIANSSSAVEAVNRLNLHIDVSNTIQIASLSSYST